MKSTICPKCFEQITEDKWVFSCQNSDCKERAKVIASQETVKGRGGAPACRECKELFASPICPECGFSLHLQASGSAELSISVAGASGSGKSHFIAVLLEELKHSVSKAYNCSLFPLGGDETIDEYDRQYYQPLYVRGQTLPSTEQSDVLPLIYSVVFNRARGVKALDLTFYDACGANFESITEMSSLNRNIYHSGGLIFLVDPSQLPVVGEWQAAHGGKKSDVDPVAVLSRTVHILRKGSGQKSLKQKISTPIAVCVTKLDTVKPLLDASSFLKAPSRNIRDASFDKVDFEACNMEAQSLIESWGGGEIIRQVTSQFAHYGFFGFSSLGSAPSHSGAVHHLVPHRVTDPLLWLLWKNKIIK